MITLPEMPSPQEASWIALLELYEQVNTGWALIGGQLVHLHCAERGMQPTRPTSDIDAVVDVRADPAMLHNFTSALERIGFAAEGISADGIQHRWRRGQALIDVLLPEGLSERAERFKGVSGSPTISTQGGTQALRRSQVVRVTVGGDVGSVIRPNLIGALVLKAAAHANPGDSGRRRHRADFIALSQLITARDFADESLSRKDIQRVRAMLSAIDRDPELVAAMPGASNGLTRVKLGFGLSSLT